MTQPGDVGDPASTAIAPVAVDRFAGGNSTLLGRIGPLAFCVFWLLLLSIPFVTRNDYIVSLGVSFLINLMLIASLNLLIGYCGQISLGHAGFFGLGAYTAGIVSAKFGINPWAGLPASCIAAALVAVLIGIPVLRLKGHYLAMATLGFNAILSVLFNQLVSLTGGPNGLLGVKPLGFGTYLLDTQARIFPLLWLCAGLVMLGLNNLIKSRVGRALRALAGSELAAESLGVNAFRYKLIVFALTGSIAGLAGCLYIESNLYASPDSFDFSVSILLLAMVALGGWGRYFGAVLGALIYTAAPEILRTLQDAQLLIFGAGMILVLQFFPRGLAGIGDAAVRLWRPSRS
ncbi:MAG TPA: branched-chain amino acid ABC transporter permease [Xanthobacteraceae bacterium]|jgi:branched-chain amino acid transport system permease protein